jgi:uncharacterized protein YcfJ
MWSKVVTGLVSSGLLLGAQAAYADHHEWRQHWDHDDDEPGYVYGRPDYAQPEYVYARVVHVEPIVRYVRVSVPRQECWTETQYEHVEYGPRDTHPVAGSMILGGLLGAVVGNQIGAGDGRRAATVAGAIIGSAIGHEVADRRNSRYVDTRYSEERPYDVQRCQTHYETSDEQRVDGYRVTYVVDGREYTTRMPYDPGDRMRVRVDVEPEHCD